MAKQAKKKLSFEEAINRLEEIIQLTDAPVTQLEEMIALAEEGNELLRYCRSIIEQAELRIETLKQPVTSSTEQSTIDHEFTLS